MADLSAARDTKRKLSPYDFKDNLPVLVGATIYQGSLVGVDANGDAVKASDATCVKVVGRACKTVTVAVSGDRIEVEAGIFCWTNAGSTAALADTDRYQPCYVLYDGTVTNDTGGLFAGLVQDVDSDGVWVLSSPFLQAP